MMSLFKVNILDVDMGILDDPINETGFEERLKERPVRLLSHVEHCFDGHSISFLYFEL